MPKFRILTIEGATHTFVIREDLGDLGCKWLKARTSGGVFVPHKKLILNPDHVISIEEVD